MVTVYYITFRNGAMNMIKEKDIAYEWKEITSFVGGAGLITVFIYYALYFLQ